MEISILVLTADRKACVQRLVAALLRLQPRNFEVIFVVGESKDDTQQYLESLLVPFPVTILKTDSRKLTHNRNAALRAARSPLVVFIDDDALPLHPDWHQRYVEFFRQNGSRVASAGGPSLWKEGGLESPASRPCVNHLGFLVSPPDPNAPHVYYAQGNNMAIRRSSCLEAGGFDEFPFYSHDEVDLATRLEQLGFSSGYLHDNPVYHFKTSNLNRINGESQIPATLCSGVYYSCKYYKHMMPRLLFRLYFAYRKELRRYYKHHARYSIRKSLRIWRELFRYAYRGLKTDSRPSALSPEPFYDSVVLPPVTAAEPAVKPMTVIVGLPGFTMVNFGLGMIGGTERQVWDLCHELYRKGHNIIIISSAIPADFQISIGWSLISASVSPCLKSVTNLYAENIHPFAFQASFAAAGLKLDPRSIFFSTQWDGAFAPLMGNGIYPVVTCHVTSRAQMIRSGIHSRLERARPQCLFDYYQSAYADGLVCSSRGVVEQGREMYGLDCREHPNFKIIPLGVFPTGYQFDKEPRKKLLWASRLERRKGIADFLEILPRFLKAFPDWEVDIVGNDTISLDYRSNLPTYRKDFLRRYAGEPWISRVTFHGVLSDMALHSHYATADLYVLPSHSESFGLTFQEVMQYGVPVIGYAVGGVAETIDPDLNGVLVPLHDREALGEAVMRLAGDAALREKMGKEAKKRIERHNLNHSGIEMEAYFDETLKNFSPSRPVPPLGDFIAENEPRYVLPFLQDADQGGD